MISMTRAREADVAEIVAILLSRREWLHARGLDQWSTRTDWSGVVAAAVGRGDVWVATSEDVVIGTITLTDDGDSDFWTQRELSDRALYMSKMATTIEHSGAGLGRQMIAWAQKWAHDHGYDYLRWDAWRTNSDLISYYLDVGATWIRTERAPKRKSGALFEIPTGPRWVTVSESAETKVNKAN